MRYRLNIIFGLVLSFVLTMSTMCIAVVLQGPGGPGMGLQCILDDGCEAIVDPTTNELCCPCADSSDPSACTGGGNPDPPLPPTTDPPNPPRPCTDPGTGDPCFLEDEGIVAGKMVECTSPEIRHALSIAPVTDYVTMGTGSADCTDGCGDPPCGDGSDCTKCNTGGGGGGMVYTRLRSLELSRRLVPANQVELFSFGRGMASEYDMRLTFYPSSTGDHVGLLYDPRLETTFYLDNLALADNVYYTSITLTDTNGAAVTDPALAATQTVYATVTRRNGWVYKMEVCQTPLSGGEFISRLLEITGPNDQNKISFTYQTHTQAEIDASPSVQLKMLTMADGYGNSGAVSYNSQQQSAQWVISQVDFNSGEAVIDFTYTGGFLTSVSQGTEVSSTYTHMIDPVYNMATLSMNERLNDGNCKYDTLMLSLDYQNGDGQVVNQFTNIQQARKNGAGQVYMTVHQDPNNAGHSKILYQGRMVEYKVGESIRWYTSFTDAGTGYGGITGTLESTYAHSPGMTASLVMTAQPPTSVDESGRTVTNSYDSNGNLTDETYQDLTVKKYQYDSNNQVTSVRDRAGYVRVIERDSDNNIVRVIRGMTDFAGTGTFTATPEATQDTSGYYGTGHASEGLVKWTATEAYSGATFSEPAVNSRKDYEYTGKRLSKIISELPNGQTNRPEQSFVWVANRMASEVSMLGHTTTYSYDALGRLIQTLYSDGTTSQTWFDDVNKTVYQKNRVDVVSKTVYGASGRRFSDTRAYGRDTDISDGVITTVNSVNDSSSSYYYYLAGVTQPSNVYRDSALTTYSFDHRGRIISTTQNPRVGTTLQSLATYVDNQPFYTTNKVGTLEIRSYYGYSADGQTVRSIQTRKPGVTFTDNAAVLAATRIMGASPDHAIEDVVRDVSGKIVMHTDANGIQNQTTHDAIGRDIVVTRSKGSLSVSNQSSYDAGGNVTQSISEIGLATDMTYDDAGNLQTSTVAPGTSLAATTSYTYTADGKRETITAPDGGITTTVYQTCCALTTGIKNALGHGTISNSNSVGQSVHTATIADFDSHTNLLDPTDAKTLSETTTKYRDDGRIQYQTVWKSARGAIDRDNPPIAGIGGVASADGVTTQYVYDSLISDGVGLDSTAGLTVSRLGGGTGQISIKAAVDKLAESIANGGAGISFGNDQSGNATIEITPDEKMMSVSITDATGRRVMTASMTGPAATTPNLLVNWNCNLHDQVDSTTTSITTRKSLSIDIDGNSTASLVDGYGRTIMSVDQLGNTSSETFNAGGSTLTSTDALASTTTYTYDDLERNLTVVDALGNTRSIAYDATTGQTTSQTDAKGNLSSATYDALGRVSSETDRLGKITSKTYDSTGQLATMTDAENRVSTYVYNLLGQRTSATLADGSAKTMTYDEMGRLLATTLPSGESQTNVYEAVSGVLDKIEYRDTGGTLVATDDMTYDDQLRPISSVSQYGVTRALTYTDRGQLDTDTTTYSGQLYVVDHDYDDQGELIATTYPSGRKVQYTRDARNLLDTIVWDGQQIQDRSHNAGGVLTSIVGLYGNVTYAHNNLGRVTSIANTNVGTVSNTFDANGNKLTQSWTGVMSAWDFTTQNTGTYTDGYDAEDRIRNFVQSGQSVDLYLDRSDIGNISNFKLNGADSLRGYSNVHELTSVGGTTQTFNANGDLVLTHNGIDLERDVVGRVSKTTVSTGDTAGIVGENDYGYDVSGKRVWKKITRNSAVAEHSVFIYAGPNCIAEYASGSAAASPNQEYVYGQEIDSLAMIVRSGGTQKLAVHRNSQWSITALSDANVLERYAYSVIGNRTIFAADGTTVRATSSYNNPYGYTSRRHDDESGLLYFRNRYYDSSTGEFVSRDPLEYVDGMSLYRAYFVPGGTDPEGKLVRVQDNPAVDRRGTRRPIVPGKKRTLCGKLSFTCSNGKTYTWRVYGNSDRAHDILSVRWGKKASGCVTFVGPRRIECTGGCKAIKGWKAAPGLPILDHEACHACAYEQCGFWIYMKTAVWDNCDDWARPSNPQW